MSPMFVDKKDLQLAFSTTSWPVTGTDQDPITCGPYMDIYVAEIAKNGTFNKVGPIVGDSINTEDSEGTLCIDGRAKTMFFTRCPNLKKQNLGCDIWMSEAGSKGWEKPIKLSLKSNDSISVGHLPDWVVATCGILRTIENLLHGLHLKTWGQRSILREMNFSLLWRKTVI
jgi:hypothetical protein